MFMMNMHGTRFNNLTSEDVLQHCVCHSCKIKATMLNVVLKQSEMMNDLLANNIVLSVPGPNGSEVKTINKDNLKAMQEIGKSVNDSIKSIFSGEKKK